MNWKPLVYHNKYLGDYYLVSDTGLIKSTKTGIVRKLNVNHNGYYFVCVSLGSREIKPCIKIHRAVAETFISNPNKLPIINHKDGNKLNNNVENLEWCTYQYNTLHAIKNNLINLEVLKEKAKKRKIKALNDNVIFDSISDAGEYYKPENKESGRKNISRALNKNGIAYGNKWQYI